MRRGLNFQDRVGVGWRTELAPSIFSHLEHIDIVEVIIDDYLGASTTKLRALKTLSNQIPVLYHGVGMGLASSFPIEQWRIDRLARALNFLSAETWSEHLAFVRAGGIEIGHLAAPPRTVETVEGALQNLDRIRKAVGSQPVLENIASLIDPPGSKFSEPVWVANILQESNGDLLLDLHNLYANAVNFGVDPVEYLKSFPLHKVGLVHLSGGKWIKEPIGYRSRKDGHRLLDDHVHDVPKEVYELLGILSETVSQPLTVIIERDGEFPEFKVILQQIAKAREVLESGRMRYNKNRTQNISNGGQYECSSL